MSDLKGRLAAESSKWISPAPDIEAIAARGRRFRLRRMIAVGATVALLAGGAVAGVSFAAGAFDPSRPSAPASGASEELRAPAATTAIRAMDHAGLIDVGGTVYDYTGIEEQEGLWIATFERIECTPREFGEVINESAICDRSGETARVHVRAEGDTFRVVAAEEAGSAEPWNTLVGFSQNRSQLGPAIEVVDERTLAEQGSVGRATRAWLLWTGPVPSRDYFVECTTRKVDADGNVLWERDGFELGTFESEDQRDGNVPGWSKIGNAEGLENAVASRFVCATYRWEIAHWMDTDPIVTQGYTLSDITTEYTDPVDGAAVPARVRVGYTLGHTDDVAGTHECTWTLFDRAGKNIGTEVNTWGDFGGGGAHDGLYNVFEVNSEPGSVTVECSPERVDDPGGYHDVTITKFEPRGSEVLVGWDAVWRGDKPHGGSRCLIKVLDGTGASIAEHRFRIEGGEAGEGGSEAVIPLPDGSGQPADAEGLCEPLTSGAN